ncbi:hypothetical protein [Sphingopyxis sp. KK2]|uniref:hypothetical protein n=1 Tax=Sphingopyxis sp. KK2 TaxID=1855727 RepID=UPI0011819084|nr:hypothetical protein [Sphingopyxis sp. KK2]
MILTARAGECAETSNWSPEAIEAATFYRVGKVLEEALMASSSFTPTQWTRLKSAYASADKAILNRIFAPMIDAEIGGGAAGDASDADQLYLGRLMLRTGLPLTEANSEFVGAWMAARMTQEHFAGKFTKF